MPATWQAPVAATPPPTDSPRHTGPWWTAFNHDELNQLVQQALDGNRDLKAASSRIAQAAALSQVAGAALQPTLSASASVGHGRGAGGSSSGQRSAGLDASLDLDIWRRNQQTQLAAATRVQGSTQAAQAVALALQAQVAGSYFQLLSLQDRLALTRQSLATAEALLRILQVQHRHGAVSALEVVRQQGLVAQVQAALPPLEQARDQTQSALSVLLGRPPQALGLQTPGLAGIRLPQAAPGLPASLLERRPDLRQAESDLAAAHADVAAARAALLPGIRLTASGGAESSSLTSVLRSGNLVYALAASLTAPIFDGQRLQGQVALSSARQDELLQRYQQAILQALREVEDSLVAARRGAEQAQAQQQALDLAREALKLAERRHAGGIVDQGTVLDAQRVLLAAQSDLELNRLARYNASIALFQALGGHWE